jgi:Asp-tRNA(Asn)/Glu-tRNA(Gln) amidotransferase A subunit family amidase
VTSPQESKLAGLSAVDAAAQMRAGEFTAREYAAALLAQVREVDPQVQAWAHLDEGYLLRQADAADATHAAGAAYGDLQGVPVGLKDIIDTAALPTENGTVLHAGRQPQRDVALVDRLIGAGGLVMGKAVTTELATYSPGKTRNPHDPQHTPGGSSSGSAAAVAAGMTPLAVGTQTNGSVIRPASFCGVVGFKPTAGLISRRGVLKQSPTLDQIGLFARDVEDVALLAQCLAGHDADDPATRARATPPLLRVARQDPPVQPAFAFVKTPMWDRVSADAQAALMELVRRLGERVAPLELPPDSISAIDWHHTIMESEIAASFRNEFDRGAERLSASLRGQIERGRKVTAVDYRFALERKVETANAFDKLFEPFDAVLTLSALGTAPRGLETTGDPIMCTLWTFGGQPAISLPLLKGANGLPIGVQLVGRRDDDARLLRTARWLMNHVSTRG